MVEPTTDELILAELKAIRRILDRLERRTFELAAPKQQSPGKQPESSLLSNVKGIDKSEAERR